FFFFSSRRRHTRFDCDWSSDVCSSDLRIAARADCSGGHVITGGCLRNRCGEFRVPRRIGGYVGVSEICPALAVSARINAGRRVRSEERRVGKECRRRGWEDYEKKKRRS